ncbi:MAG: hypothetical protein J6W25_04560 [Bacilli bacterium]|nr:hypothetical protein [Bacilli bacterium]
MNKSNFKEGVKFLHYGYICEVFLMGLAFIMGILDIIFGEIAIFTGIMSIIILLATIAIFVLKIIGIIKARNENKYLKYAFYVFIGVVAFSVISMIFNMSIDSRVLHGILAIITGIGEVLFLYFLIEGIGNVFKTLDNEPMVEYAKKTLYIVIGFAGLAFLLNAISSFLPYGTALLIIDVIATVLQAVAVIFMYLLTLKALENLNGVEEATPASESEAE